MAIFKPWREIAMPEKRRGRREQRNRMKISVIRAKGTKKSIAKESILLNARETQLDKNLD